eukprot:2772473-Pyramimonas_sp.AAC.1
MRAKAGAVGKGQQKFWPWVRSTWMNQPGRSHKHVKDKPVDTTEIQGIADPTVIMHARQQHWQKIWTDQVDTMDDIIHGLAECHQQALEEDLPSITLQELDVAPAEMSAKKAKGTEVRRLSE